MTAGRPRKISPEEALEKAMILFWTKGYDATSISDLVAETGMVKASLYKNFGDKKELYQHALSHYFHSKSAPWVRGLLQSDAPVKETIFRYLNNIADGTLNGENPLGCFLVNTSVECAVTCPEIAEMGAEFHEARRHAFTGYFQNTIDQGKLKTDHSAEELAEYYSDQTLVLANLAKAGGDRKRYDNYIKIAMAVLD